MKKEKKKRMKRNKIIVSQRALLRRVNRWLKREERQMFKVRRPGGKADPREAELGAFFIVQGGTVVERKVNIESFARQHGVLAAFEAVGS